MHISIMRPEVGDVLSSDKTGTWVEIGESVELNWDNVEEATSFAEQLRDALIEEEADNEQT